MDQKRVLVTGAGGFVGRFLQAEGYSRGHEVYGSFRNPVEESFLLDRTKGFFLEFGERQTLVDRLKQFAAETGGFEYVIHCAGVTRPDRMEEFFTGNVEFTEFFVKALIETQPNFRKFIFISSLQALGPGDPVTMAPINEATEPKPFTPYGISKYEAEKRIMAIPGLDWLIFRPTSVYGPRDTKFIQQVVKLVQKGIAVRVGPPGQLVSFVYVKDLARVLWDAVELDVRNEIFVVADGHDYDPSDINRHLAKHMKVKTREIKVPRSVLMGIARTRLAVAQLLKKPLHLSPYKIMEITSPNWRVDITKLRDRLGFVPRYSLEEGLKEALKEDGVI
jgi:nucleoside-diphosphate-sugar epimerase